MIGETIGNFKILKRVGTGGMGEVWLAEQQSIGTHVAIKILNESVSQDTEHVQRFFNEARAVSRIQHAGIVKIFDVGMHAGRAYLIMEYLEGETLSQRLKQHKLPFSKIGDIGRQIATVLDATHSAGVTHRDLKPDNIFLVPDRELGERVKILDFGIAKLSGTLAAASPRTLGTMGTPSYMAPEQWGDTSKVDWRADLYSLGCVTFEMTCGRVPFEATNIAEACGKHINEPPPKASSLAPAVPASLERLIARLLEKDPADRPASMREVASAFAAVDQAALGSAPTLTTAPVSLPLATDARGRRSPLVPILLGVVALAGGVAGAVYVLQPDPPAADEEPPVAASTEQQERTAPRDPVPSVRSNETARDPAPASTTPPEPAATPAVPPPAAPDAAATPPPPAVRDAGMPARATDAAAAATRDDAPPAKDAGAAAKPAKPGGTQKPTAEAGADAEALVQAVRARSTQTNQCYEAAIKEDPSISGMVTLQLKIDGNGRVASATADGMSESLQACLLKQVRAIRFPVPADPPVSLIVPFRFERE